MRRLRLLLGRGAEGEAAAPDWQRYALIGAAIIVALALLVVGFRLARPGVLPGTTLDGYAVGGLDEARLGEVVDALAEEQAEEGVEITAVGDDGATAVLRASRGEVGEAIDVERTVTRVWRRGRQLNPLSALADHLRAFGGGVTARSVRELDEDAFEAWSAGAHDELEQEPTKGDLAITGTTVSVTPPEPGLSIEREELEERTLDALDEVGAAQVEVPAAEEPPDGDPAALRALADEAERAVSGPVRLTREEAALELSAEEVGALLEVDWDGEDAALAADAGALDDAVDDDLREALETDPVDAEIRLSAGEVVIEESVEGFDFDPEVAAGQLVDVATAEASDGETPREAELDGEVTEPDRTTADAEELGITEQVASFTTNHPAGQSRVQNIQRMADLVDGVVLEPGEELSLNEHVGPRTREGGFTDGGVIVGGEFQTAVGGGVSQFATTFFNAAFFGGYEILDHQPHSYYISRYPEGREATLNYPNIDVAIRNDSPYGLLIATGYSATSITVSMWGTDWVDVEARTSGRRDVREPPVEHRDNEGLAPGTERVVQSGRQGFTISYTRVLHYHDGGRDEQTWTHTYRPEPRIIERNTSDPEPDEPDPEPDEPEADDDAGADDDGPEPDEDGDGA